MGGKKELTDALIIREVKYLLRNGNQTRESFNHYDINNRSEFGHWEGDTIVCKDNLQCLFTLVERVTRFGIIKKIKTKSPACILNAMQQIKYEVGDLMFGRIFKSITFDNGVEFNCHKEIEEMDVKVFFTHPYSSYERVQTKTLME